MAYFDLIFTVNEKLKSFDDEKGPFALDKNFQVPKHRKLVDTYKIKYHEIHTETDGWVFEFPKKQSSEEMAIGWCTTSK